LVAHDLEAGRDQSTKSTTYPILDASAAAAVAVAQQQIVTLRQRGRLTERQIAELQSVIEAQIADSERLHAFPLTNADEPAFVVAGASRALR
jgi:hypothetical protein